MASPLRIGLIGAGWIATDHVFVLRKLGHDIVAVCDIDLERAQKIAPEGARTHGAWEELLGAEELDAVWIATPPLHHRAPAVAALEQGLPVFLEKPIARTLEDAFAIADAAERAEVACAIGYQWHATEALEHLVAALGEQPVSYLWGVSVGPTAARPWFLERSGGGGNLLERGSHQLDLQRAVAGDVASVQVAAAGILLAQSELEPGDIEDAATITLRFEKGAVGTVLLAWTRQGQPGAYTLDVLAPSATLHVKLDPAFTLTGQVGDVRIKETMTLHPFERSLARFVEAVETGRPDAVFCTPRDAIGTLATALACERSLLEGGRAVTVAEVLGPDRE
jgi:predicted dehydrogenase